MRLRAGAYSGASVIAGMSIAAWSTWWPAGSTAGLVLASMGSAIVVAAFIGISLDLFLAAPPAVSSRDHRRDD